MATLKYTVKSSLTGCYGRAVTTFDAVRQRPGVTALIAASWFLCGFIVGRA